MGRGCFAWGLVYILAASGCTSSSFSGDEEDKAPGGIVVSNPTPKDAGSDDVGLEDASTDAADSGRMDAGTADLGMDAGIDGGADAGADGGADAGVAVNPLDGRGPLMERATGFEFLEGPRWFGNRLVFSDIPAGRIYQMRENDEVSVFRGRSNGANGLEVLGGSLLVCEHGNRRLRLGPDPFVTDYNGDRFNSPNDLAVRSDGTVYFSDPEWGIIDDLDQRELDFNGLFRVDPRGEVFLEWSAAWVGHPDTPRPNGVELSADESLLYMTDDRSARILIFEVALDGSLSETDRTISTAPVPDGMAMDEQGNLYVGTEDGVEVYAPDGRRWGLIETPRNASNAAFGDPDSRTLFITAGDTLHSVRLERPGIR